MVALAGIFTDAVSGAVATVLGFTGLLGGAAHYGAILASRRKAEVERATALGFFIDFALGSPVLLIASVA